MPFALRTPVLADADRIAALHVATWREAYTHLLPEGFFTPEFIRGRQEMWRRMLAVPGAAYSLRVAEAGGELIGLATAGPSPDGAPRACQLYSLYVLASHHGTGVGQALLDAVLGDEPAVLWVAQQNPRAIAFYRRNGFAFDGAEQIDPGASAITDLRMVR